MGRVREREGTKALILFCSFLVLSCPLEISQLNSSDGWLSDKALNWEICSSQPLMMMMKIALVQVSPVAGMASPLLRRSERPPPSISMFIDRIC
ncbi:unnamed protein product [Camellia sinensis]